MIKAGIIGGSNPMAGELIRLLINHPDVEIMWVDSARYTGRLVSDVHHGLLGDTELRISPSSGSLDDINALFIFRHKGQTIEWLSQHDLADDVRIIDLSVDMRDPANAEAYGFVYGMPELNRKAMVRGARRAIVPHPVAVLSLLALLPMAKAGELNAPIDISVSVPALGEQLESAQDTADEILRALKSLQPEMQATIALQSNESTDTRVMSAEIGMETGVDIGEMMRMYEEFYDDHNFTFMVNEEPQPKEVAGTNKCLLRLDKSAGRLVITGVMDALIKGAAGTAVHDMNLLFGLHERVGLTLKASRF